MIIRLLLIPPCRIQQHRFPGCPQRRPTRVAAPLGGNVWCRFDTLVVRPCDLVLVIGQHPAEVLWQVVGVEIALVGVTQYGTHAVIARHDGEAFLAGEVEREVVGSAFHRAATQGRAALSRGGGVDQ